MRDLAILFVHLIVTLARLAGPGGLRSVVAESVLLKHQLVIDAKCVIELPSQGFPGPLVHEAIFFWAKCHWESRPNALPSTK